MYEELTAWDNLSRVFRNAARGKRGLPYVAAFEYHLEENLLALQEELKEFRYQPGRYDSFYIHEPKRRLISAAPFRDRVVHHALCQVIEPIFERSFIMDSYANRVGKGTHRALARCQQFMRRYRYVIKCDVRQFFPSIDHAILRRHLHSKICDESVMWLIDQILESGRGVLAEEYEMVYFRHDDLLATLRPRGLPIGNLTSQFWANVYLNALDHFVKRELRLPYIRYVDDFLLFSDNKEALWHTLDLITLRLQQLRLTIHPHCQPVPVNTGVSFLGFVVYPQRKALLRRKGIYFQRRLKVLREKFKSHHSSLERISATINGWVAHVKWGNTIGLRRVILGKAVFRRG